MTSLGMLMPLGKTAAPGEFVTALMVTPFEFVDEFEAKCPASPPTRAATSKSEMRVDHGGHRCARGRRDGSGLFELERRGVRFVRVRGASPHEAMLGTNSKNGLNVDRMFVRCPWTRLEPYVSSH